tara:strand:+ start:562 stop:1881 length:1320 start_codon:yes stop_codon:yes gene_type:complete
VADARNIGQTSATEAELLDLAGNVLNGGALGFLMLPREADVVIREGRGSKLISVDGREYIDFLMGSGPMLVGHCHPRVIEAVEHQMRQGTTFYFLNEPAIRLAEQMIEAVPCAEEIRYVSTGSDATFLSLRAGRAFAGRSKILKFEGGWHGTNDYAMFGTVPQHASDYPHAESDSLGVPDVLGDEVLVAPFNDAEFAEQVIDQHAGELGAVIVEPLQRVLKPEPGFLQAVRDACTRHGIVLIFDEIVTGFRLAWGGAQEAYGVVPDLACYGKAMAGGYPLAVIAGRKEVMDAFGNVSRPPQSIAWASGTFNGNPIGSTAALAAMELLSAPGVYDQLHRIGSRLRSGIEEAGRRHGLPVQALGEDMVFGVRFMENSQPKTWVDLLENDKAMGSTFAVECVKRGILIVPNEKFYISIAHTDEDVDRTLEIIDEALKVVAAG